MSGGVQSYVVNSAVLTPVLFNATVGIITLYNPSTTATINVSNATSGIGFPLGPGSSMPWDAGQPLYASISSGSGTLYVFDNAGSITNPQILASLIVGSGLGADIAANIKIQGAPPINGNVLLYSNVFASSAAAQNTSDIDTHLYNSVNVYVALNTGGITAAPQAFRQVRLEWSDTGSGGNGVYEDAFIVMDSNNVIGLGSGYAMLQAPVRGAFLTVYLDAEPTTTSSINTVRVEGNYRSLLKENYLQLSNYKGIAQFGLVSEGLGASRYTSIFGTKTAGTYDHYPDVRSGFGHVHMEQSTVTAVAGYSIHDAYNLNNLYYHASVAVGAPVIQDTDILIPNRPILMRLSGTGNLFRWVLTFNPD